MNTYPLAERFHSLQGEGEYTGVLMHFVRLSGCNVGVYSRPDTLVALGKGVLGQLRQTHPDLSICCSATGEEFLCDTKYNRVQERLGASEILERTFEKHLCITGGEPFLYDLSPLLSASRTKGVQVHIETSGTRPIYHGVAGGAWITCSPKKGFLQENAPLVHEFKFVIDARTGDDVLAKIDEVIVNADAQAKVYLQPVNCVNTVAQASLNRVLELLRLRPAWRLSVQLHKLIGLQ